MRFFKVILVSLSLTGLVACGGGGGGGINPVNEEDSPSGKIAYMNISDASLITIGQKAGSTTSNLGDMDSTADSKSVSSGSTLKVFKMTEDGGVQEITYLDADGNEITDVETPVLIQSIDENHIVLFFGMNEYNVTESYIVNKTDNSVFKIDYRLAMDSGALYTYRTLFKMDKNNNIYTIFSDSNLSGYGILKISQNENNSYQSTEIIPMEASLSEFIVDEDGNIIYTTGTSAFDRVSKLYINDGTVHEIDDSHAFWIGLDGNFYSDLGIYNRSTGEYSDSDLSARNYAKYEISGSNYTRTLINVANDDYKCFNSYRSHIMTTSNKVMSYEYASSSDSNMKLCELYNDTMIPKNHSIDMKGILDAKGSNNFYYILGADSTLPGVFHPLQPPYIPEYTDLHPYITLRKYNPADHSYTTLIEPGNYAIFTFTVTADDILTFSGVRLSDQAKVLGRITNDVLEIIDESSDVNIFQIEDM